MTKFVVESCRLINIEASSPRHPIILATPEDIHAWQQRGVYPSEYISAAAISEKLRCGDHCFVMIDRGWPLCWQLIAVDHFVLRIAGQEYWPGRAPRGRVD